MADVNITVDGKKITAPAGTLLIEACKSAGIEVPSFCYYPGLSLQGACRMCLVRIEKMPKLQTACTTVISEGMTVSSDNDEVRQARKAMLEMVSHLGFDLHALIGGQLADDPEPTIFLIYPVGNWIQIGERTPYLAIGNTGYGKPILDRALRFETPLRTALKLAYLSFDSTRLSSADVGFPIDLATLQAGDRCWRQAQFQDDELRHQGDWWNEQLKRLADTIPNGPWLGKLLP